MRIRKHALLQHFRAQPTQRAWLASGQEGTRFARPRVTSAAASASAASAPKISFCTTCMGRGHHVARLYARNVERALSYENVEFVLLDYASRDGLAAWAQAELRQWLERDVVRFFKTDEPVVFHMAHAKNTAHRLATGDILVNLDADNAFEAGFAEEIAELFRANPRIIAGFGRYERGCMGRIAVRATDFRELGGYDEKLSGWGYEDTDFARRAIRFGLSTRRLNQRHALALQHSDEERVQFTSGTDKRRQHRENESRSKANLAAGRFIANAECEWGAANAFRCFAGGQPAANDSSSDSLV